ncbi:MAG: hypothetical protein QF893_04675 [Alphaproteobacteria bacterium]|jgi:23S rRNA (uracil1939-C5)-methyltransferase|nr:hypothetical protein [Alphaproteobacteria bacterium]
MSPPPVELTIDTLGGGADGIAQGPDGPVYVPYALPGERVAVEIEGRRSEGATARLVQVLEPARDRVTPACPHFGRCGGCALQHLAQAPYLAWKRQRVVDALARRGLNETPVHPTVATPAATRRRVRFAARRSKRGTTIGFNARRSRRIVDLTACPVLRPVIPALLPALRRLLDALLGVGESVDLQLTETTSGIDLWIVSAREPDLEARQALAAFAAEQDLARLHWGEAEPQCIVVRRPAAIAFADVAVEVPADAFLQASIAGEAAIRDRVLVALGSARDVADLFAGCGTLSLPLAAAARVHAVDQDEAALTALAAAARARPGLAEVTVERRDLFLRPLGTAELGRFDAVVFDPPRAGARAQATAIASSSVPLVVAVSCHPGSFSRDARILIDGGYDLVEVVPIDQFLWSPHVELVATFRR